MHLPRSSYSQISWLSIICLISISWLPGCAYNFGFGGRSLPQGYSFVAVPIFSNSTFEPGLEVEFTNAVIEEIERSGVARVVDNIDAQVILRGAIHGLSVSPGGIESARDEGNKFKLPEGSALSTHATIVLYLKLELVRKSDRKIIWAGQVRGQKVYQRPNITIPVINSANPLYDLSEKRNTFKLIAQDVSTVAFDRLTERF